MALPGMDEQSLELVLRMQLDDLQALIEADDNASNKTDQETALETYKAELQAFESHRAFCYHIASGGEPDDFVAPDHNPTIENASSPSSLQTSGIVDSPASDPEQSYPGHARVDSLEDQQMDALRELDELVIDEVEDICSQPEDEQLSTPTVKSEGTSIINSESGDSRQANQDLAQDEAFSHKDHDESCAACGIGRHTSILMFAECPCGHQYCEECFIELVSHALTDESLFPPRCCNKRIAVEDYREHVSRELVERFKEKRVEYNTSDRTYCHQPSCSAFIPILVHEDTAQCPKCEEMTCPSCKGAAHDDQDCPEDPATKELLQLATDQGWQRCYNCRRMVEIDTGCNHMTCKCHAQFCYLCGERWKSCQCEPVTEAYLWARAAAIVDRDGAGPENPGPRAGEVERQEAVRREMRNQRRNHECSHVSWRRREGQHQCEECQDTLDELIFECRRCRLHACGRCRRNRL